PVRRIKVAMDSTYPGQAEWARAHARLTSAAAQAAASRLTFHSSGNIAIRTNRRSRRRSRLPRNRRLTAERPNTFNPRQCEIPGLDRIAFDLNHYGGGLL